MARSLKVDCKVVVPALNVQRKPLANGAPAFDSHWGRIQEIGTPWAEASIAPSSTAKNSSRQDSMRCILNTARGRLFRGLVLLDLGHTLHAHGILASEFQDLCGGGSGSGESAGPNRCP